MAPQTAAATQLALHTTAKVLPGNKIEIQLPPDAVVGEEVNVFVMLPKLPQVEQTDILKFIEAARKRYANRTAEEIDRQIQAEKDAWDS